MLWIVECDHIFGVVGYESDRISDIVGLKAIAFPMLGYESDRISNVVGFESDRISGVVDCGCDRYNNYEGG